MPSSSFSRKAQTRPIRTSVRRLINTMTRQLGESIRNRPSALHRTAWIRRRLQNTAERALGAVGTARTTRAGVDDLDVIAARDGGHGAACVKAALVVPAGGLRVVLGCGLGSVLALRGGLGWVEMVCGAAGGVGVWGWCLAGLGVCVCWGWAGGVVWVVGVVD